MTYLPQQYPESLRSALNFLTKNLPGEKLLDSLLPTQSEISGYGGYVSAALKEKTRRELLAGFDRQKVCDGAYLPEVYDQVVFMEGMKFGIREYLLQLVREIDQPEEDWVEQQRRLLGISDWPHMFLTERDRPTPPPVGSVNSEDYLLPFAGPIRLGLLDSLCRYGRRLRAAWRNARGRWPYTPRVTLRSQPLQRYPDGLLTPEPRDIARIEGIERLLAMHPWSDTVDLRMYLIGFDAGERWASHNPGSESKTTLAASED
jgi:hypothetical protein